jgi:hypothetical protein
VSVTIKVLTKGTRSERERTEDIKRLKLEISLLGKAPELPNHSARVTVKAIKIQDFLQTTPTIEIPIRLN